MATCDNVPVRCRQTSTESRVIRWLIPLVVVSLLLVFLGIIFGLSGVDPVVANTDEESNTAVYSSPSQDFATQQELDSVTAGLVTDHEFAATATGSVEPSEAIHLTYDGSLATGDAETVEVTVRATIPDEYVGEYDFRLQLWNHADVTIVQNTGFDPVLEDNVNRFYWDGSTTKPTATFEVSNPRYEITQDWALLHIIPTVRDGSTPVDAPVVEEVFGGTKGNHMLFLGEFGEDSITVGDHQIRLVRPAGVEPDLGSETILTALADASHFLDVGASAGDASQDLFVFANPDMLGGAAAINTIRADPDGSYELWFHEYLHTRQDYRADVDVAWIVEAEATYYQYLLAWKLTDYMDFEGFQSRVGVDPDEGDGVVITDPDTNPDDRRSPSYWKGAAIIGALDQKIREETSGEATYQDVLRTMNENYRADREAVRPEYPLRVHSDYTDALEEVVGDPMDEFVDDYVFGDATPDPPDDPTRYSVPSVTVTLVESPEAVTEGEELTLTIEVENDADWKITRQFEAYLDGVVLGTESSVTLEPGERRTVEIHTPSVNVDPGETYELDVFGAGEGSTTSLSVLEAQDTADESDESGSEGSPRESDDGDSDDRVDTAADEDAAGESDDSADDDGAIPGIIVAVLAVCMVATWLSRRTVRSEVR